MGFGQGLSGLNAAAQNLDVIGNNVANASTVGFKSAQASFADVYASSRVGLGVKVSEINQRFSTGTINTSASQYHMAIDGSNGFFRLVDTSGKIAYSRNGEFGLDKNNQVVNAQGYALTGYPPGGVGAAPVPLVIPQGNIDPQSTTSVRVQANLPANAAIPTMPFDPALAESYSASSPATVYDSLGNSHMMTQYFVKQPATAAGEGVYNVHYVLNSTGQTFQRELRFDESGRLTAGTTQDLTFTGLGGADAPAADIALTLNYTGTTQFGGDFKQSVVPNGYATGVFSGVSIGKDGSILGAYTNGQTQVIGTVALANFANVQGLTPIGDNAWTESPDSGAATIGQPGSNGLATLAGQALEASNVDMSRELVDMIVAQRTYQANAQTIKTQDQVLQTLLQIR